MPQIPLYRQQTSASQAGLGPGPEAAAPNVFQALAVGVADFSNAYVQRQEERAAVAANEEEMAARSYWMQQLQERKQNAPAGADGFTEQVLKDYDEDAAERVKRAGTKQSQRWLKERLTRARLGVQQEAMGFEASSLAQLKLDGLSNGLDAARTAADFRPDDFDEILEGQLTAIAASGLPDLARVEMAGRARTAVAAAAVGGMVRNNPYAALKELGNEQSQVTAVQALDHDDRQRLRSQAEGEIRRRQAEARARAAEARDSLREAEADAFAAKASGIPAMLPSRGQYVAAYGGEGAKRYEQASKLMSVYDTVAAAVALPPAEGAQLIAAYRPAQQQGAAAAAEVQRAAATLYQQQRKALEADPAAGIMARDAGVRDLFVAATQGDAQAAQQYVKQVRGRAEAMGLPGNILPQYAVDSLSAELSFDPERPGRRVETLQALKQQWGRYYPQVVRELAPKMEGDARIVAEMRPEAAKQYDRVVAQGRDKVMGLLDTETKRRVQEASREALAPFVETMLSNPDAEARINEHIEAVQLMTASLVNRGADPRDAAERAADMVVRERYNFRDSMRIPVGVDADAVARGAERMRAKIDPKTLAVRSMTSATLEEAQLDLADLIAKEGAWFTTADETGMELRVPVQGDMRPVVLQDGTRLRRTWAEFERAPQSVAAPPDTYWAH